MRQLVQRTQPTSDSCMSAALAIVADMDVSVMVDQLHHDLISGELWFDDVLDGMCIEYKYMFPKLNVMRRGKVYIATVPSLNLVDSTHSIVIDVRDGIRILDPNFGRPGKLFYGDSGKSLEEFTLMIELDGSLYKEH